ncbi:MAG TPA: YcxB family protein [Gemmataceae bacterium]|nr:YcxB family protein [Gemmataceae bacterium]
MQPAELSGPFVRVDVVPQFRDLQAVLQHKRKKRFWRITIALLIGCLVVVPLVIAAQLAWYTQIGQWPLERWLLFGLLGLLLVVEVAIDWLLPHLDRRRWRKSTDFHHALTYIFSPSGINIITWQSSLTVAWQDLVIVEHVNSFLVLATRNGAIHVIPDEAFASPEDRRTFEQLATALTPKCKL